MPLFFMILSWSGFIKNIWLLLVISASDGGSEVVEVKDLNSSDFTDNAVDNGGTGLAVNGEGRLSSGSSGTVESDISACNF